MLEAITFVVALFVSPLDVDGLRTTAPSYLTDVAARENLAAAYVAGALTRTDPAMLLSIAHHESRYSHREVTPESGGRFSCGSMTPEPTSSRRACSAATASVVAGYAVGAVHLRGWLGFAHDNLHVALLGYAGGVRLIRRCAADPSSGCYAPLVFKARASMIRRAMRAARGVS